MTIIGEHYHVYNRGAHKAPIFSDGSDYEHFIKLLHVANSPHRLEPQWYNKDVWTSENEEKLVSIFAYCLMPNHFHIGICELTEKGVERFLRRLCKAYSMYFNFKYKHSGTIFQGRPKAKLVDSDEYYRYLIEYIHLNPFGIEEPNLLREAKAELRDEAVEYSKKYKYSSYKDYLGEIRPQNLILLGATFEVRPP